MLNLHSGGITSFYGCKSGPIHNVPFNFVEQSLQTLARLLLGPPRRIPSSLKNFRCIYPPESAWGALASGSSQARYAWHAQYSTELELNSVLCKNYMPFMLFGGMRSHFSERYSTQLILRAAGANWCTRGPCLMGPTTSYLLNA